jgi:hypothetical protein
MVGFDGFGPIVSVVATSAAEMPLDDTTNACSLPAVTTTGVVNVAVCVGIERPTAGFSTPCTFSPVIETSSV